MTDQEERRATLIQTLIRVFAFIVALTAMGGSLYFSEVLHWIPCDLCWYQRICMYPLTVILLVGILRRDPGLHLTVLPLSGVGACIALYHYLLIKTHWFLPPPCKAGVPCTTDYIDLLGFINIPFMALTAFLLISLAMAILTTMNPVIQVTEDEPAVAV